MYYFEVVMLEMALSWAHLREVVQKTLEKLFRSVEGEVCLMLERENEFGEYH